MRSPVVILATLVVPLGLVACGSSDKTTTADSGGSVTTTTAADRGGSSGANGSVGTIPNVPGVKQECLAATQGYTVVAAAMATMKDLTPDQKQQLEAAKASVPAEIKDDFDVVAATFSNFKTKDPVSAATAFSSPEFQAAAKHIEDYFKANCPN